MFEKLIEQINAAEKIAIFNHEHPDGDAFGSAYGLKLMLCGMGKQAEVFLREGDESSREYKLLKGTERCGLRIEDCDLKIAVDCAEKSRLGALEDSFCGTTAAIDHHVTHKSFADVTVVVPSAPAAGEIVFDLVRAIGAELTADIANNLYLAIICDTGSFKYSSTTPKTHAAAAELMKTGIDFAEISKKIFDTKSFSYLHAYKKGIECLEMYSDGKIALLAFTDDDFASLGIDEKQADAIVTLPACVESVEVGIYMRQRGRNEFKVSLRSNGSANVAEIAMSFGGGGHVRAAGFTVYRPLDEAKREVVAAIEAVLGEQRGETEE